MPNSYYNHSTYPAPNAPGSSAALRAELDLVTAGFNKLPTLAGNAGRLVAVNGAGDALVAVTAFSGIAITGGTINNTPIGGTTPSTGAFTTVSASSGVTGNLTGNVTGNVTGNLTGNVTSAGTSTFANVVATGGSLDNVVIGATTAQTVRGTTITATSGLFGNLTGNVTGNVTGSVTGNVTGNVTGDVSGNLSGNVTAGSGTSTFNNVTINGTLDMNAGTMGTITGLANPVNDSDAANKGYVDSVAQGLDIKGSVRVATTASVTLSGTQTIDGVPLGVGDRVLVKDQATQADNGIYVVASGSWTRSTDMNAWAEVPGAFTFVEDGATNDNSGWVCTAPQGGTLGSTAITFEQFSGAGQITAGAGMTKTGNTLNVGTASSARIVVNADNIDLAATGVTGGTYTSVTVDIYGRVTAATSPTTLGGYGIGDAYTIAQIDALFGSTTSAAASAAAAAGSASAANASATSASGSASTATSAASTATSAANAAAASYDDFDDRYLGAKSSPPSVDNDGNPLITGALYFDTTASEMRVWTGSAWKATGSAVNGTAQRAVYTASAGDTTFAIVYDVGYVDVYLNGVKQQVGVDFVATSGTNIVFAVGLSAGDIVDIVAYGAFTLANVLPLTGGTMSGLITFAAGQTFPDTQATLVSGTNIKTINGTSVLGGGNLAVGDVTQAGTQTLTNKTITNIVLDGSITEDVYNLTGTALDPANGTVQTKTLSANTTFTDSLATGQSMILGIDDGTAYTVTWPTITWTTNPASAPTLPTSGYLWVVLWKVGTTLYGKY